MIPTLGIANETYKTPTTCYLILYHSDTRWAPGLLRLIHIRPPLLCKQAKGIWLRPGECMVLSTDVCQITLFLDRLVSASRKFPARLRRAPSA